jgi:MFS family permease
LIALFALPVGVATRWLPRAGLGINGAVAMRIPAARWLSLAVLFSVFLFFAEQNAVWAFAERIGSAAQLSPQFIGFALGVATLVSAAGAGLVAWLGSRLNRFAAVLVATVVQAAAFVALGGVLGASTFLVTLAATAIAWNVVNPLQLGILAEVDTRGTILALAPAATGLGLAVGPAVGSAVTSPGNYQALLGVCIALAVGSSLLLWFPLASARKRIIDRASR